MTLSIKQIKDEWETKSEVERLAWIEELKKDPRKGVQQLLGKFESERKKEAELKQKYEEMTRYESRLYDEGYQYSCGVDECGRGPLAGSVVSSAVILPKDCYIPRLDDSKKLSEKVREELYEVIMDKAIAVGIGIVSAEEIDQLNIYQATKRAMTIAIKNLGVQPDYLLIDALELDLDIPQEGIIKGDSKSVSIAAASIIAKVTRDRMMKELAKTYPQYGFEKHMGYGTKQHMEALEAYGPCVEHRRSFAPVRDVLAYFE